MNKTPDHEEFLVVTHWEAEEHHNTWTRSDASSVPPTAGGPPDFLLGPGEFHTYEVVHTAGSSGSASGGLVRCFILEGALLAWSLKTKTGIAQENALVIDLRDLAFWQPGRNWTSCSPSFAAGIVKASGSMSLLRREIIVLPPINHPGGLHENETATELNIWRRSFRRNGYWFQRLLPHAHHGGRPGAGCRVGFARTVSGASACSLGIQFQFAPISSLKSVRARTI